MIIHLHPFYPLIITDVLTYYFFLCTERTVKWRISNYILIRKFAGIRFTTPSSQINMADNPAKGAEQWI